MRFDIITLFPEMLRGAFQEGVLHRGLKKGIIEIHIHDLREFAPGKHRQVDDRPFGGGRGMVLKPEPIFAAVEEVKQGKDTPVYLLSPQGRRFDHKLAERLAALPQVILICGRYEGVDERVTQYLATEEISIGDYVLTGGEPAAVVIVDAVTRFVPGVVGRTESVECDSFIEGLFDFPQYTRPRQFKGMEVPEILFSGDHQKIDRWRKTKALEKTSRMRPDLMKGIKLSSEDRKILEEIQRKRKER